MVTSSSLLLIFLRVLAPPAGSQRHGAKAVKMEMIKAIPTRGAAKASSHRLTR